jgi:site-specific DNA-cytosine methylase
MLQIGNAVPPPMGAAIGFEIRKCISVIEERRKAESKMEIV